MRRSGELVQWNDERGFGFVRDTDGKRHFVHISDIRRTGPRPQEGDQLTFVPSAGRDGRPVAILAILQETAPLPRRNEPVRASSASKLWGSAARLAVAAAIILVTLAATQWGLAPAWLTNAYLILGAVSMGLYTIDKSAAESGGWRTREATLHFADLIGGIAGGLVAQAVLRHKVRKPGFAAMTWSVAMLHIGALSSFALGLWRLPPVLL